MPLQSIKNINIDFYDKKYILVNAKQYDKNSRFLSITCYNRGEAYGINPDEHSAYIRYRKSDNNSVFNFCEIDSKGNILVELTEQMLASDGICCADLVIVNKGSADVNVETGEIISIDNSGILSTMPFHIDVTGTAVENSNIESSYEFNGLNSAIEKAEAEYEEVMKTSKSWAVGGTGTRDNEDTNNSKYWSKQSQKTANASSESASNAATSASNAAISEANAATSEANANGYMDAAMYWADDAEQYMYMAQEYKNAAYNGAQIASDSQKKAKESETNAAKSATNAELSFQQAYDCGLAAYDSELKALKNAEMAQSYAVGGTGTRDDEDVTNAAYYYELIKNIVTGLDTGFIPMGTISFSDLATVEKATGYIYNINEDFVTDETFREGSGKLYTAGTNVYYTANGQWDCFGGTTSPTATVAEVKAYLGIV